MNPKENADVFPKEFLSYLPENVPKNILKEYAKEYREECFKELKLIKNWKGFCSLRYLFSKLFVSLSGSIRDPPSGTNGTSGACFRQNIMRPKLQLDSFQAHKVSA